MRRPVRLLRVDLSSGTVGSEPVPDRWLARFVGGKGLGARYLYAELSPGTDPLGPGNALAFATGPLTGYLPGEPRYAAVTKSPLTGAFLDSYAGGTFPGALAGALAEHALLFVTGRADEPVRIVVADGDARIEPTDAWGADAVETARATEGATACIGPAGENRVAYATIASDGGDHHAGRGGAGAVMGSKRLKAVVARGECPEPTGRLAALRDRAETRAAADEENRWLAAGSTYETVDFAAEADVLAARGWTERGFEAADEIGIERAARAAEGRERDDETVPGGFRVPTDDGGETVPRGAAPMTLGAGLGIDDFDAVAELGALCDRLGVDVISAGNAVAWAVRAAEAGYLPETPAAFGDPEGARGLIERIARREDGDALADALAEGVRAAADRHGGADLVPTVKGMELPAYDPRGAVGMALAYATSDRGACHRRARPIETEAFRPLSPLGAARAVAREQTLRSALWCLVADDFLGGALSDDLGAAWLDALDGPWPTEAGELWTVGERVWTLTRLFNLREGIGRTADELPSAFREGGDDGLDREAFATALEAYYAIRGWDATGRPTRATLARLGLADLDCAGRPPTAGGTAVPGCRDDATPGSGSGDGSRP